MKKYTIVIEETIVEEIEVIAQNEKEALENARQRYKQADFVLEPGELQHVQMMIVKSCKDEDKLEWIPM